MNKETNKQLTLSDIVRGMQYCVNTSTEIAEQHYIKSFEKFYDERGNFLTQKIRINEHTQMEIPLICLNNHNSIELDEMSIKMHININNIDKKTFDTPCTFKSNNYMFTRGCLSVSLGDVKNDNNENSIADIEMKYKRNEPPEAVARLIDILNNAITTSELEKESEANQ